MNYLNSCLFATLLCLSTQLASAQFSEGSRFVGGGFSIETPIAPKLAEDYSISLQPEFGKFRSENVAIGLLATLSFNHEKVSDTRTTNAYTVGIGPFVQRFLPVVSNFGFVLTGRSRLSISSATDKTTTPSTTVTITNNSLGLSLSGSPGMFYAVNERWLLLLDLGSYQALTINRTNRSATNTENRTSGSSYGLGRTFSLSGSAIRIRYFLP